MPLPPLYFYLDDVHFPHAHADFLSLDNHRLLADSAHSTWLCWTLRTYLHVREHFDCRLFTEMPRHGVQ